MIRTIRWGGCCTKPPRSRCSATSPCTRTSTCSADADRVFPWQRRERVVEFNREARVAAEAAGGRFVDLAPATEGARATSDGVHYLTAVNLVKARIFIALLHMSHDI